MALVSPGIEVQIIDESQYASARINTVPYILLATAENKINAAGTGIAPGTVASANNDVYLITSQRELVNTFGEPFFYKTSGGNSIHGYELNEYGLMTAYSTLGASNRAYVHRVDVDLAELSASLVRPTGAPNNGTTWLDLNETEFGIFEWNSVSNTFNNQESITVQNTIVITNTSQLEAGIPAQTVGQVGQYAIVATNANNPVYRKLKAQGTGTAAWVLVGSDDWKAGLPTVQGTVSNPTITPGTFTVQVNGGLATNVTVAGTALIDLVNSINAGSSTQIKASIIDNKLEVFVESGLGADFSSTDTNITVTDINGGTVLADAGVVSGTYNAPVVKHATHTEVPRWRGTDTSPRPSGSLWIKTTAVNAGLNFVLKKYDTVTDTFVEQAAPAYASDQAANKALDPGAGGKSIAVGDTYVQYNVAVEGETGGNIGTYKIFSRNPGETVITLPTQNPVFVAGHQFIIGSSALNSDVLTETTITLTGTTPEAFATDVISAGIPFVTAEVTTNGRIRLTHTGGGVMVLQDTNLGVAVAATGITDASENVRLGSDLTTVVNGGQAYILSNWNVQDYYASTDGPGQDPLDGSRWYYSAVDEMDIMINDNGAWRGYKNVVNDMRGFDLTTTNDNGPQLAFNAPVDQEDGSPLVYGDLWIDSSDLENYPALSRWEQSNGLDQWVRIDTADGTSTAGLVFADARWGNNDNTDPITAELPVIADMLGSDYVDVDVPNPNLYPEGMLLWNTRRSGYNVKEFRVDHFNAADFGDSVLPTERNAWVTVSGLKDDGRANMGRQAQRALVVAAMRAAIDTSEDIREEQSEFNLLCAPGYPELIPNMVALNNERKNTGFIVGDTPLRLANNGNDLVEWATNNGGLGLDNEDGLVSADEYLAVFYPSGKTTDLTGSEIIVPASHMIMRTILHSDDQSYPWFAPAGIRRGQVDNVIGLGYVDANTGEFQQMANRQGLRDVLYQNNVNPIAVLPGAGIVNYGNKTTKPGSALDRINVARLVNYIRVQLDVLAKPFLFEPNDELTRNEFKNVIESLMNDLVAKRALYDYAVVCNSTNNTPARIDRNELWADIAIEPVKAVEFIFLPVRILNTGEISG